MVSARIRSTLTLKKGCEEKYDILLVRQKLMSTFSEERMDTYKMSKMFVTKEDSNLLIVVGTELVDKDRMPREPGTYLSISFHVTSYPSTWVEEIAPLVFDGSIRFTYITEASEIFTIVNGVVTRRSLGLFGHLNYILKQGLCDK